MNTSPRKPFLAAVLSLLVPGLGQLYVGRIARALAFAAASALLLLILGTFIHSGNVIGAATIEFFLGTVFAIVVSFDAWRLARKAPSDYQPGECNRIATYVAFTALAIGCSVGLALLEARRMQDHMQVFRFVGKSMNPTLLEGDMIFVDHDPYLDADPKPGEMIVYRSPKNRNQHWTSRVIAVAGQTVEITDGILHIDGKAVPCEQKGNRRTETLGDFTYEVLGMGEVSNVGPVTVPDYQVFLLSDNRSHSVDSRVLGPISISALEGRLAHRYLPRSRRGSLIQSTQE